jgi:hypothetical protein
MYYKCGSSFVYYKKRRTEHVHNDDAMKKNAIA